MVLREELLLLIQVVLTGVLNCHINILLDRNVKCSVLHGLAILSKLIEHGLHEIPLIGLTEMDGSHVGLHQVPVVVDMVPPSFEVAVKSPLPQTLFIPQHHSCLMEHLGEEQLLGALDLEELHSALVLYEVAPRLPSEESFSHLVLVTRNDHGPELLDLLLVEVDLGRPDSDGPLHFLLGALVEEEPDLLDCIGLEHIPVHLVLLVLPPGIEHL